MADVSGGLSQSVWEPRTHRFMPPSSLRIPISHVLVLAGVSFLAITPFFWMGIPSGHDFEVHVFSWLEVLGQWKQGIVYPRWAALAHWGYGEARFLFYPPASWMLGAALGALLPWKLVPGAYCWMALLLAGASMYYLAREWLSPADALFAAVLYAVNPYHLVIVYWRSAYAELLAAALLPLLLLSLLRLKRPGVRPVLCLSLTLAAAWLTNAPAAVMIHYSAAGLATLLAARERSWRLLFRVGLAVVFGIGLASFYLLPAIFEEKWINLGEVLGAGVRPQDNFLFTTSADVDHNRFNLLVSCVALAEIGIMALAIWRSHTSRLKNDTLWLPLSAWGAVTTLLMFSISNPLWQYLPKFRFVQLPFRWLLCLNAALALLLALATRRWITRALAAAALLAVLLVAGHRIQEPWWDHASDIQEMKEAMSDGTGNEGIDEYVPAGADPYELNKDLPRITDVSGRVPARIITWGPIDKHFIVEMSQSATLTLRLFNYPAWQVTVNDRPVETETMEATGQMLVPVAAGQSDVRIHFGRTLDRTIGDIVSMISLLLLVGAWIKTRGENATSLPA